MTPREPRQPRGPEGRGPGSGHWEPTTPIRLGVAVARAGLGICCRVLRATWGLRPSLP